MDTIHIDNLELQVRIGTTDDERKTPQRMTVSIDLEPAEGLQDLRDDIARTVDYFRVCEDVKSVANHGSRHLVETLAEEIAQMLLASYPLAAVHVDLRKYILRDTAYVAVRIHRPRTE